MGDCCGGKTKVIYACSGASDVGMVADEVVRKLNNDGYAKMSCVAAIGADSGNYVDMAHAAGTVIVVDGCPVECARKNLERIGVKPVAFVLTDMGLVKGKTVMSAQLVSDIAQKIVDGGCTTHDTHEGGCGCNCSGGCH